MVDERSQKLGGGQQIFMPERKALVLAPAIVKPECKG